MKAANRRVAAAIVAVGMAAALAGCTATEQGTATGAGVGGVLGGVVGHNLGHGKGDRNKGALIGAGLGALVGNQMGRTTDRQNALEARVNNAEAAAQQETVWITNSNGSKSSVVLRKGSGDTWFGPKGESYNGKPTEAQLKAVYGF